MAIYDKIFKHYVDNSYNCYHEQAAIVRVDCGQLRHQFESAKCDNEPNVMLSGPLFTKR